MPETAQPIPVHVEPKHWAILTEVLRKYSGGRKAWAYGSRATGRRLKRYSDLDIALSAPPESDVEDRTLEEAFDWCHIPYRVEYVVLPEVSEAFRKRIEPDLVELKFE